jgi:HD superfamily phosphodiesterase
VTDPYAPVWREALPYLRARKNDVHVPLSYAFAERLLEVQTGADREIVLLAILLHDVGWAVVDQEAIFTEGFGPGMLESDVRIAHEKEGARIAREILEHHAYPHRVVDAVVAIVDGHDTRLHAISPEDEVVKDADKLWRFTVTGVAVSSGWFGLTPDAYAERLSNEVIAQLFTPAAVELARAELAETRRLLKVELLTDVYEQIYAAAEPYWQTRENHVHVPASYGFCRELLEELPAADEAIALPAILLHDVGYHEVPEEDQPRGLAGAPTGWDPEITRRHEVAGARIAGEILTELDYGEERIRRIQEIVDGHDSRPEALGLEDAIVKDADKLWRYTEEGIRASCSWLGRPHGEFMDYIETRINDWLLTEPGKRRAGELLARSRASLSG